MTDARLAKRPLDLMLKAGQTDMFEAVLEAAAGTGDQCTVEYGPIVSRRYTWNVR